MRRSVHEQAEEAVAEHLRLALLVAGQVLPAVTDEAIELGPQFRGRNVLHARTRTGDPLEPTGAGTVPQISRWQARGSRQEEALCRGDDDCGAGTVSPLVEPSRDSNPRTQE